MVNTVVMGVPTGCSLQDDWPTREDQSNCLIQLSGPGSPVIFSVSPALAVVGDAITIGGHNLSPAPSDITVYLNGIPLPATTSGFDFTTFTLPDLNGLRGELTITLHVAGLGTAVGALTMTSQVIVSGFTPNVGSFAGGLSITLSGAGFSTTAGAMLVQLGSLTLPGPVSDALCTTDSTVPVTSTSFACITPVSVLANFLLGVDVQVPSTRVVGAPLLFNGLVCTDPGNCMFGFTDRRTPIIYSVKPLSGPIGGTFSVFGTG